MSVGVTSIKPAAANRPPPSFSKLIVTAYRWLGFLVLTCILAGLVGYIGQHLFYFLHRGWLTPAIISPADPSVLDLSTRVAHETWMRQQVEASRAELTARVERNKKAERLELSYQESFRKALALDAAERRMVAGQLSGIDRQYRNARGQIEESAREYSELARERSAEQLSARLIDQDAAATRMQKLSEIVQSNIALRDRQNEIASRMSGLYRQSTVLDRLSQAPVLGAGGLTFEGLGIAKQYELSVMTGENAVADRVAAERSLAALDTALEHYDALIKTLETSALLRAANKRLNLAFVPYANSANAQPGISVFGCRLDILVCRRVGRVKAALEGEVIAKHPIYGSELRGQYFELEIDDAEAMRRTVLHLGRAPLFI